MRTALAVLVAALTCCCLAPLPAARAACLRTAKDLQAQARESDAVLKALAMSLWTETDGGGTLAGHFAIMAVYKGARAVKNVLHIGGTDLFNISDK